MRGILLSMLLVGGLGLVIDGPTVAEDGDKFEGGAVALHRHAGGGDDRC